MKSKIIFLSTLLISLLIPQAVASISNGTVARTMDNDYLRIGDINKSINITLVGNGNFSVWGAVEMLPSGVNVSNITPNASVSKIDETHYSLVTINGPEFKYNITLSSDASDGIYQMSGTFKDYDNNTGNITPDGMNIRILPRCINDPVCYYDTNGISGIQKSEAVNAVSDYFNNIVNLDNVLKVVHAYLGI